MNKRTMRYIESTLIRKAVKSVLAVPPIYSSCKKAALSQKATTNCQNARSTLMKLSPKPGQGWRDPNPSPRDQGVDLSIIVPVYNEVPFVRECLHSVLKQKTSSTFEVVVVDDGSTDSSPEIIDELASSDSRLRVIHQENRGFSGSRNVGLDLARGGGAHVRGLRRHARA